MTDRLTRPIRWVRVRGEPFANWHVEDRPAMRNAEVILLMAMCGQTLGQDPDGLDHAGFGVAKTAARPARDWC